MKIENTLYEKMPKKLQELFVLNHEDNCPCKMLDEQSGELQSSYVTKASNKGSFNYPGHATKKIDKPGGASRFFYCAKASKSERNAGLDSLVSIMIEYEVWKEKNITKQVKKAQLLVDTGVSTQKVTGVSGTENKDETEWNTVLFGKCTMDKFLKVNKFTTKTEISSITKSQILNWLKHFITNEYIVDVNYKMVSGSSLAENVKECCELTTIMNERLVSALGVKNVVSGTPLKIKLEEGKNIHSTVKPIKLMEYLCTLTKTPTGGTVLDPFAGSGTTGVACINTDRDFILIEREPEYIEIIKARIEHAQKLRASKLF